MKAFHYKVLVTVQTAFQMVVVTKPGGLQLWLQGEFQLQLDCPKKCFWGYLSHTHREFHLRSRAPCCLSPPTLTIIVEFSVGNHP